MKRKGSIARRVTTGAVLLFVSLSSVVFADSLRVGTITAKPGQAGLWLPVVADHAEQDLVAFSFALKWNPSELEVFSVRFDNTVTGLNDPDFAQRRVDPSAGLAVVGVIFDTAPPLEGKVLPKGVGQTIAYLFCQVSSQVQAPGFVQVGFSDGEGDPPAYIEFVPRPPAGQPPQPEKPFTQDGGIAVQAAVPPSGFTCALDERGGIRFTWQNTGDPWESLRLTHEENVIATIDQLTDSYLWDSPPEGAVTCRLEAVFAGGVTVSVGECSVFVGRPGRYVAVPTSGDAKVHWFRKDGVQAGGSDLAADSSPKAVCVTPDGLVWVAEGAGPRTLQRFEPGGVAAGAPIQLAGTPVGMAVVPQGVLWVAVQSPDSLVQIAFDGTVLFGGDGVGDSADDGILGPAVSLPRQPGALASGPLGNLWIACPQDQVVLRVAPSGAVKELDISAFGGAASAVAVDIYGNAWFALFDQGKILRISFDGLQGNAFELPAGELPTATAVDALNVIWVGTVGGGVYAFSPVWDQLLEAHLAPGSAVTCISFDGRSNAWITCKGTNRLYRIDRINQTPELTASFGTSVPQAAGDMTGYLSANLAEPDGDYDLDNFLNREELIARADPFDPQRTPVSEDPSLVPAVLDLICTWDSAGGGTVTLTWTNRAAYDGISITRNGESVAELDGSSTSFTESGIGEGSYRYTVTASMGGTSSDAVACELAIGPLASGTFFVEGSNLGDSAAGLSPAKRAKASTEGLYVLDSFSGHISFVDRTGSVATIPNPLGNRSETTAVAYDPASGGALLLVKYENSQCWLYKVNLEGEVIEPPAPLPGATDPVFALDYDRTSGLIVAAAQPEDIDIFTYRRIGDSYVLVPELSSTGPAPAGLEAVRGVCFSPYHASSETKLHLLLLGTEITAGIVEDKVLEVALRNSVLTEVGPVLTVPRSSPGRVSVSTGLEADETFIYIIRPVSETFERHAAQIGGPGTFLRGDANADGRTDLSDSIAVLLHLFAGKALDCLDAADANDDGLLTIADPVALLNYLFAGGEPPPPPFPFCGTDPSADELSCTRFPPCF